MMDKIVKIVMDPYLNIELFDSSRDILLDQCRNNTGYQQSNRIQFLFVEKSNEYLHDCKC